MMDSNTMNIPLEAFTQWTSIYKAQQKHNSYALIKSDKHFVRKRDHQLEESVEKDMIVLTGLNL